MGQRRERYLELDRDLEGGAFAPRGHVPQRHVAARRPTLRPGFPPPRGDKLAVGAERDAKRATEGFGFTCVALERDLRLLGGQVPHRHLALLLTTQRGQGL